VIAAVAAAAGIPIVYSYLVYRRIDGAEKGSADSGD
jgi:hypothetical protein